MALLYYYSLLEIVRQREQIRIQSEQNRVLCERVHLQQEQLLHQEHEITRLVEELRPKQDDKENIAVER